MSHFTTACAAQWTLFTCAEWREVVVQQELLGLANQGAVDELLVELGAQRQCRQALGLSTCEDGRTVATWEVIHFRPNGTNFCGLPTVEAKAVVQNQVTHCLLLGRLDVVAGQPTLLFFLLVAHGGHECLFQFREAGLALFFRRACLACFVELGVHLVLDAAAQRVVVRFVAVLTLVAKRAHLLGQFVLSFTLGLDGLVCLFDGVNHLPFADFLHFAFNHDNAVKGSGDHDVHVGLFQFRAERVDDKFSVHTCHADL